MTLQSSFAGLESIPAVKWLKQHEGKDLHVKFGANQFYRPKTAIAPDFSIKMSIFGIFVSTYVKNSFFLSFFKFQYPDVCLYWSSFFFLVYRN